MIRFTWKQRFFALAAVFAVFVIGLGFGIVISGSSGSAGNTRLERVDAEGMGQQVNSRLAQAAAPLPEDANGSFAAVAESVLPTVVEVSVVAVVEQQAPSRMFEYFFGPRGDQEQSPREFERSGFGSGVIVEQRDDTVYVLTNNHVVGKADEIEIGLYDGRSYEAELVGSDVRTDLALVRFTSDESVPVADLGSSDNLRVGDWVLAVGNPFGFHSTVTAGIVSATGRRAQQGAAGLPQLTDFIQTDAAINPGNSGGALVNMHGEVVGINTWIVGGQSGGSVGLGFAIPMSQAVGAIEQFIEQGKVVYGWLGVSIADPEPDSLPGLAADLGVEDQDGSLILNVYRDSPAARSGIRPGDFVTAIEGEPIADTTEFQRQVGSIPPGESREFSIIRDGSTQTLEVTLAERAPEEELGESEDVWPGVTVLPLSDEIREEAEIPGSAEGVVAAAVQQNSPAAVSGIRPGDLIIAVGGTRVDDARGFYRETARDSGTLELTLLRNGIEVSLTMPGL